MSSNCTACTGSPWTRTRTSPANRAPVSGESLGTTLSKRVSRRLSYPRRPLCFLPTHCLRLTCSRHPSSPSRSHPKVSFEEFNAEYNLQGILARGTFSVVRKALARTTQEMVAIKIVDTTKFPAASTKSVQREIEALTMVSETGLCRSPILRSR